MLPNLKIIVLAWYHREKLLLDIIPNLSTSTAACQHPSMTKLGMTRQIPNRAIVYTNNEYLPSTCECIHRQMGHTYMNIHL